MSSNPGFYPLVASPSTEFCEGSGIKPVRKGSKRVRGALRYRCPVCGGHFAKDKQGLLHRHGYRLGYKVESDMCTCATCGKSFNGLDYICPKCRSKESKVSA